MRVCRLFSRAVFGFAPGWLALALLLGGTAVATAPVSRINIISDASQSQSGGSGFVGPAVIAQAAAQPTMQPGNPYVGNYIMGEGISHGIWETCYDCVVSGERYGAAHHHVLWVNNPGDATGAGDIAIGGAALASGDRGANGQNIGIGVGTMESGPLTGYYNEALGNLALKNVSSGYSNVAIGYGAGNCITSGYANFVMGDGLSHAYRPGCTANGNVLIGSGTAYNDHSSVNSVAIGTGAGQNVTGGSNNVFLGERAGGGAGIALTSSVFIGPQAGQSSSSNNTVAIGITAGGNTTGSESVFIGDSAARGSVGATAGNSVVIGALSGKSLARGGNNNVLIGFQSGSAITSATSNTILGTSAGINLTTGGNNVAVGPSACNGLTTGSWNICIGNNATLPSATGNGQMTIANAIYGCGNNTSGTGVSAGGIAFYTTTCVAGEVYSAVPVVVASGACTGGVQVGSVNIYSSTGAPSCTAPNGSLYMRSDGTTGSRMYVSAGGGTWNAVRDV